MHSVLNLLGWTNRILTGQSEPSADRWVMNEGGKVWGVLRGSHRGMRGHGSGSGSGLQSWNLPALLMEMFSGLWSEEGCCWVEGGFGAGCECQSLYEDISGGKSRAGSEGKELKHHCAARQQPSKPLTENHELLFTVRSSLLRSTELCNPCNLLVLQHVVQKLKEPFSFYMRLSTFFNVKPTSARWDAERNSSKLSVWELRVQNRSGLGEDEGQTKKVYDFGESCAKTLWRARQKEKNTSCLPESSSSCFNLPEGSSVCFFPP